MMHLQYSQKRDYFTWDELSCLSRALGFQSDTIHKCVPDEITEVEAGLSFKMIQKLIDLKYFSDALDVSINMHSADYNINSVLKSLKLVNHRLLSFAELHDVRVAFQVYEAGDMRGMKIDQHTLIRTLKLCGRTIAPLKLMHRVKHMKEDFDEPGRIQLYEFLDLIVLCEQTGDIEVPDSKRGPLDKTWRKLFELDDFKHVCTTNDEKLLNHLNQQFRNTELNYGQEHLGSKRIPRESAVDSTVRKTQVRFHGDRYRQLHKFLDTSTACVQGAKAGGTCERLVTATDVDRFRFPVTSPVPQLQRPRSVPEDDFLAATPSTEDPRITLLRAIHDRKTLQSASGGSITTTAKYKQGSCTKDTRTALENTTHGNRPRQVKLEPEDPRPQTTPVVSAQEVIDRQNMLDTLQYEIETLEERRMQKLKDEILQHMPGYNLDNLDSKKKKVPKEKTKKCKPIRELQPSLEVIERLVHPNARAFKTLHDKNCDSQPQLVSKRQGTTGCKRKSEKTSEKMTILTPLLVSEGRHFSESMEKTLQCAGEAAAEMKDDLKDGKGNLAETASTVSSRTAESSIGKSTDLTIAHTSQYHTVLGNLRKGPTQQKTYDRGRYQDARVGTAAILYNHFNSS